MFLPPATRAIIIANVVIFLLQSYAPGAWMDSLALWPLGANFAPWQLITYAFLHGGTSHIFLNMFALFMFGRQLESFWGSRRFTLYYFLCVLAAGVTQLIVSTMSGSVYPTVGASGGVFGLLLAFAMYFPKQRIVLLF